MSYCVNCGVELAEGEKYCPLCNTEVINPNRPEPAAPRRPYPPRVHRIQSRVNKLFWAQLLSLLLGATAIICCLIDLLVSSAAQWSLYVLLSLLLIWLYVAPLLLLRRPTFLKCLFIDSAGTLVFLFAIELLTNPGTWFLPFGMPLLLWGTALTLLAYLILKHGKIKGLYLAIIPILGIAFFLVGLESLIALYFFDHFQLNWSLFAAVPLVTLAGVLVLMEKNKKLKAEISRRLHI